MGRLQYINSDQMLRFTEGMREHRDLMVKFCSANEVKVTNIMFRKPVYKIATYENGRNRKYNLRTSKTRQP